MKLHWQMVGIVDLGFDNMVKALREIKAIGYDGVEFAGFHGWKAPELRKALDDAGLVCVGNHFTTPELKEGMEATLETALTLGMPALGGKTGVDNDDYSPEGLRATYAGIQRICEDCERAGLYYYVHSSTNLFDRLPDGTFVMDAVMDNVPGLHAQIDTIWTLLCAGDPATYIRKFAGRETNIHYKDVFAETLALQADTYTRCRYAEKHDCVAGDGEQDFNAIYDACVHAGIDNVIIEQMGKDDYATSMDIARRAYENMRRMIGERERTRS